MKLKNFKILREIDSKSTFFNAAKLFLGGLLVYLLITAFSLMLTPDYPSDIFYGLFWLIVSIGMIFTLWAWVRELGVYKEALFKL